MFEPTQSHEHRKNVRHKKTKAKEYPPFSSNALTVLQKRYLMKDEHGKVCETPDELLQRVALAIAQATIGYEGEEETKKDEERFFHVMRNLYFLPNSPTLMNAGRPLGQLSACFVLPVEDSMEAIFETVKHTALIHQSGGGTGFSFSRLRPRNDVVKSTQGISSGPVSFMKVFDSATEAIKQGGTRRGANMGILSVHHPDILEFISVKNDLKQLTNFNISVALTDAFMKAYETQTEFELINPRTQKVVGTLNAREVFDRITASAWKSGDPGVIFIDTINKHNPLHNVEYIESTNPCGEQPLLPYESCNLGSINLAQMLCSKINEPTIDFVKLGETVQTAVRFLDNVIDVNNYPLKQIEEKTKANRKIGLGVMGFADLLVQLGISYNSKKALMCAEEVMKFVHDKAQSTSVELGKTRGNFPDFFISTFPERKITHMRNSNVTTIAPTGTISILANCSSGIEPYFALAYYRTVMDNDKLTEMNPYFENFLHNNKMLSQSIMEKVIKEGSIQKINDLSEECKNIFVTSHDIPPLQHIEMQAIFQKYTDSAVSKTVNFAHDVTVEDVKNVYLRAYYSECKGVTVFRDGCRGEQVLNLNTPETKKESSEKKHVIPRPPVMTGTTRKMHTGCGNLYVTINEDTEGKPFELFSQMGKGGGCAASQCEAISRLISYSLRLGMDLKPIMKQLKGISCHKPGWDNGNKIVSCADAIGMTIERYLASKGFEKDIEEINRDVQNGCTMGACPDCGGTLEHESGCATCKACGYSECG